MISGEMCEYRARNFRLPIGGKTYVMGILNVTPDSFSDGGRFFSHEDARRHAYQLISEGADILDIGGESTRPGHVTVSEQEEKDRVIPIIRTLFPDVNIPISVDTSKSGVAAEAVEAGASIINDVWGLTKDPMIASVARDSGAGLVLMFNATDPDHYRNSGNIVEDAIAFLSESVNTALRSGVRDDQIMLDPGIGFGMDHRRSFDLVRGIGKIKDLGFPVLIGPSRKRFIGAALGISEASQRDGGTAVISSLAGYVGANVVRVHDVRGVSQALILSDIISGKVDYKEDLSWQRN
ncbi:MAG: dihydropteroate synthase [Clostridiaceae bacterium]|jgi:dihydropteroate synthase|nr:dihydropteroate synthase [Clostridiaceae bacterium]